MPALPPQEPESWDQIRKDIHSIIIPNITHWQSPNFFAYFPVGVSYPSILGDLLSSGLGVQGMLWITSPALTEVEEVLLDWFVEVFGLSKDFLNTSGQGGGVIQGTASEVAVTALLAAKYRTAKLHQVDSQTSLEIMEKLVVYSSDQTHSSIKRACIVVGIPVVHYREIPADASTDYALDPIKLEEAIKKDIEAGLWPSAVVSCIGSTGCCAYDPVDKITEIAKKYNLWHHVDAAFAGASFACPELRVKGLENIDSIIINSHKWLRVNFDCSLFWIKDKFSLINSMIVSPVFLKNKASDLGCTDYKDWGVPLGRRFRALKLWFVIRTYGITGLQKNIREHIQYAELFEQLILKDQRFLIIKRQLSLVLFILRNDPNQELTQQLMNRLNATGEYFLSHTALKPYRFVIRMAIGSSNTEREHIEKCCQRIFSITDTLTKKSSL